MSDSGGAGILRMNATARSARMWAKSTTWLAGIFLFGAMVAPAQAQSFPEKQIRIVVPFGPASSTDKIARALADGLQETAKAKVLVDNKPGANGSIAAQAVAQAQPDGYTLILATNSTHAANLSLFRKLNYDPLKDFEPVTPLATAGLVLAVPYGSEAKSLGELTKWAKGRSGKVNSGSGSATSRASARLYAVMAGIDAEDIQYKSLPDAVLELMGGRLDFVFADPGQLVPLAEGRKVRLLAVTTTRRLPVVPEVETMQALGFSGFDLSAWFAVFAPAGTPRETVDQLNRMMSVVIQTPRFKETIRQLGGYEQTGSPQQLRVQQEAEIAKWAGVVKTARIEPQ
ncbi:MAG: tripartite tricarboxylate transporter substrate binding protein [Rubrivivax sp.]|nr:tripartite tricarboxylate transporter substrate binding protein [Rubrivivax sp.]MBK8526378.1 tripartite tricarboxylate transporter substrate binding protein [Rubrivivax sp.]